MIFSQHCHLAKGLDPVADAFSGTVYTDIFSLRNFASAVFIIYAGVGATGTSTITVEASDDTSGSNVTAVPFRYRQILTGDTAGALTEVAATGFTTTAGSSKIVVVEVDASEIGKTGYEFVRLKAVESVDSPVLGGVLAILCEPRFAQATFDTAIA